MGGYEHTNDIKHYESYSVVYATFKIPPQNLQDFMAYAGEEGKVVNSSLGSDDVTESYYDATIRLDTKRKSLERHYDLLAGAETVDEIVYIQRIIDGITEEIESLEGKLRMWDVLSEMATVRVTLRQQNDPIKLKREINWKTLTMDDMGYLVKSGLVAVCSGALTVLQWLAVALAVTSPLWIAALIVIWILIRKRRKKREAAREEVSEETTHTEDSE